eukprot:6215755-Lingulodinium_polyedra.AAC.1
MTSGCSLRTAATPWCRGPEVGLRWLRGIGSRSASSAIAQSAWATPSSRCCRGRGAPKRAL